MISRNLQAALIFLSSLISSAQWRKLNDVYTIFTGIAHAGAGNDIQRFWPWCFWRVQLRGKFIKTGCGCFNLTCSQFYFKSTPISINACTWGSRSTISTLLANCLADSIFPQALAPRIKTAPEAFSFRINSLSVSCLWYLISHLIIQIFNHFTNNELSILHFMRILLYKIWELHFTLLDIPCSKSASTDHRIRVRRFISNI